jgi:dTDP-4-dehydrorhamnose 3,5-epimerase
VNDGLPKGLRVTPLDTHADERGALTEVFRRSWEGGPWPAQWNVTSSEPGVLRGVHLHLHHWDYVVVVDGRVDVGVRDVRRGSPTEGLTALIGLDGKDLTALTIPPGILHGFHALDRSTVLYGLSEEWEIEDDLACRWDDVGIPWRTEAPTLSARDTDAPPLRDLLTAVEHAQPIGGPSPPPGA